MPEPERPRPTPVDPALAGAPGAVISGDDPFPLPAARSDVRRLRARLTAPVALWTVGSAAGRRATGLPVSSTLVVDGEPGHVVGLLDEDTELWDALAEAGRFTVQVLRREHRGLAEAFAGRMPAPGGPFRTAAWSDTAWGPVFDSVTTWAGCRLTAHRRLGWSLVVEAEIDHVAVGDETDPLLYRLGGYLTP